MKREPLSHPRGKGKSTCTGVLEGGRHENRLQCSFHAAVRNSFLVKYGAGNGEAEPLVEGHSIDLRMEYDRPDAASGAVVATVAEKCSAHAATAVSG